MNLKRFYTKKYIGIAFGILLLALILGIYWIHRLNVAHSSFENYFNFRGCAELLEKTNTYGICRLPSGKIIKLVLFENKWYLDGDLPW